MGSQIANYLSTNYIEVIIGGIFCIIGVILGAICSGKKEIPSLSNSTTIRQMQVLIINKYNQPNPEKNFVKNHSTESADDSKGTLGMLLLSGIIAVTLYVKFHYEIMTGIIIFTIFTILLLLTLVILLSRSNQLDNMNKMWSLICLVIILYNFASLIILNNQDLTVTDGIKSYTRILTYVGGFIFQLIPNLILLCIIVYLISINAFLKKSNKVNRFLVNKLNFITQRPKSVITFVCIVIVISIIFSSGLYYSLFQR